MSLNNVHQNEKITKFIIKGLKSEVSLRLRNTKDENGVLKIVVEMDVRNNEFIVIEVKLTTFKIIMCLYKYRISVLKECKSL